MNAIIVYDVQVNIGELELCEVEEILLNESLEEYGDLINLDVHFPLLF